jgi:KDO2-lipid IV(A) lauroyltransferase
MPKKRSKKIRCIIEYSLVRVLLGILNIFPFRMRVKIGGAIVGSLIANLRSPRTRIEKNLRKIYPDISLSEVRIIAGTLGRNFGRSFIEILNNHAFQDHPELLHASGPGIEILRDAKANGKGAIIVSGHFGQWESARHFLKSEGIEVGAVYRPSNNHYFDRLFVPQIENAGKPALPSGRSGTMDMVRHIRADGMVAILLDQRYSTGESLNFMGHPAKTSTAAASLALKYDIPMIPVYGIRREDSLDVDIIFEDPIPHTDPITMSQAANDSLAAQVRRNPGQWYWLHNRWN